MHIVSDSHIYRMTNDGPPTELLTCKELHCVDTSENVTVAMCDDGKLLVIRPRNDVREYETGITDPITSVLITQEEGMACLIGTENPRVYHFSENNSQAAAVESFNNLPCRANWFTPWGDPAALRNFAKTPDGYIYAAVHVGSIMRSPDWGVFWEPVTPTLHEDVHEVVTCPVVPSNVYVNTADAVFISTDRGCSWGQAAVNLRQRYGRAIAVHPSKPDWIMATLSDGPHGDNVHGQVFTTTDAGQHWTADGAPLPVPYADNIDTFHLRFTADGRRWAAFGKDLFMSRDVGSIWTHVWEAPESILMLV